MVTSGSVTNWLAQIKLGDRDAAQRLWERYFHQLVHLARDRLGRVPHGGFDEEDVASVAFTSFCLGAEKGRFPALTDRHDLWQLLIAITAHKAVDAIRAETRKKRGGGNVKNMGWGGDDSDGPASPLDVIGPEPSAEFAAILAEDFRERIVQLGDPLLQEVAVKKMEGYSNTEVAAAVCCAPRTIERKLQLIRRIWSSENASEM